MFKMLPKATASKRGRRRRRGNRGRGGAIGREGAVAPALRPFRGNDGELVYTTTTQDGTTIDVRLADILTFPAEAGK